MWDIRTLYDEVEDNSLRIYCNDADCMLYEPLPDGEKHLLGVDKRGYTPLVNEYYRGRCTKKIVFIGANKFLHNNVIRRVAECKMRSDKKFADHWSWPGCSRNIDGGNLNLGKITEV